MNGDREHILILATRIEYTPRNLCQSFISWTLHSCCLYLNYILFLNQMHWRN